MADNIDLNGHILEDVEDASKSQGTPTLSDVLLALTISESGESVQELKHYSVSDLITALGKVATDAEAGAVEALEDAENILKSCQDALAAIGDSNTTGLRGEAIEALETTLSTALKSISSAKTAALSAIGESDTTGARGDAISAIGSAKDEALSDISTAKTNALTAIGEDNESGARGDAIEALEQKAIELAVAPWLPYPSFNIRYDQEEGTALVRLTNDYAGIGDVAMRYTINGTVPTINSAVFPAEGLVVGWNCTIKVRAFPPADSTDLAPSVTNEAYVEDLAVSEPFTPILSIQPGTAIDNCKISVTNYEAIDGMDGELRHTMDGTDPTATDNLSDGDFEISNNCTVKVKAFYLGGAESPVASIAVSDLKAQAPSLTIISDSPSESSTVVVLVSMSSATDGSVIHYSTDGSNPTAEDTEYQEIAEITPPATVKAIATKGNLLASDITSLSIPEMTMCAAPTITYDPYAQTVTIASATAEAMIHYTTDGSVPTTASPVYSTALMVTENMTIKAFAVAEGYVNSTLSTKEIVYITQLETPEISFSANTVTIVGPSGAGIHYTTDGSIPTEDDPLYSAPFAWYQNATIKAIAIADGYLDSEVASLSVSVTLPTPTLSRAAGTAIDNCTVSISNTADYSNYGTITFRYTTDGGEPSETSTVLSGSAAITANGTIKVKAFNTTANASATRSITIADLKAQTPTITVGDDSYSATMATATSGASIRYTLDGTEPTEASLLYSGEIEISPPVTIKARSFKSGLIASDTAEQFVELLVPMDWSLIPNFPEDISDLTSICFGEHTFIVGTLGGDCLESNDFAIWEVLDANLGSEIGNTVNSVCYGDAGIFLAAGGISSLFVYLGGIAYHIANSESWKNVFNGVYTSPMIPTLFSICYGAGQYIAGGSSGNIVISSDYKNWTIVSNTGFTSGAIQSICYGDGKFIAVGDGGCGIYSLNGTDWIAISDLKFDTSSIKSICYGKGMFIAVGEGGKASYSIDGINWIAIPNIGFGTSNAQSICYGKGIFIIVGDEGKASYSPNGIDWTIIPDTKFAGGTIRSICYGGGKFVAVGNEGKGAYCIL